VVVTFTFFMGVLGVSLTFLEDELKLIFMLTEANAGAYGWAAQDG
jgi:hypothetical protein